MGVNTKLHAQFVNRFWNEIGNNGETFADTGYQQTFESSRAQQGKSGILVNFTGGETAAKQFALTDEVLEETTKKFLDKLTLVLPGSVSNWNGLSTVDHWLSNQWTKRVLFVLEGWSIYEICWYCGGTGRQYLLCR